MRHQKQCTWLSLSVLVNTQLGNPILQVLECVMLNTGCVSVYSPHSSLQKRIWDWAFSPLKFVIFIQT